MSASSSTSLSGNVPYGTRNRGLAAYLVARGHACVVGTFPGGGSFIYRFAGSDELVALVTAYESGEARVEPNSFKAAEAGLRGKEKNLNRGQS